MSRIKIEFPEKSIFNYQTIIGVGMVNYGAHLGNDAVLTIAHDARIAFLNHHNLTEVGSDELPGIIQADAGIVYKSEGKLHEKLNIEIFTQKTSKFGFDVFYRIFNNSSGKTLAEVKTGLVCFDYSKGKIAPIPEAFEVLFQ